MPCLNCHSEITCGCQYRTASDGMSVCVACAETYERTGPPAQREIQQASQTSTPLTSANLHSAR